MSELHALIRELLCAGEHFLGGLYMPSSFSDFIASVQEWSKIHNRKIDEIIRGVEPSVRQSILMSLIPAAALRDSFEGSYDQAIEDHLANLGITLDPEQFAVIRTLIINIRKLRNLKADQARRRSASLADVKGQPIYLKIRARQRDRCLWCGVPLDDPYVFESLEHIVPKHLGNDMPDGSNWGLACTTCNMGKGDRFTWCASAEAYDYVQRNQFTDPDLLEREHRWVVLRRTPACTTCNVTAKDAELWVYRRVSTGLAIPSNCSTTCAACASSKQLEVLRVNWADPEIERNVYYVALALNGPMENLSRLETKT